MARPTRPGPALATAVLIAAGAGTASAGPPVSEPPEPRPIPIQSSERAALAARYPEIHEVIYDATICEYCGLITPAVAQGFHRRLADLVKRDGVSEAVLREVRIAAWTAADLEWSNRGLGGFRNWCRTEGARAAKGFAAYPAE